jgi:hypothetical protein
VENAGKIKVSLVPIWDFVNKNGSHYISAGIHL